MIIENSFTSAASLQLLQLESQDLLWSCKREDVWGGGARGVSYSQFHPGVQGFELTLGCPTKWFWGKLPKEWGCAVGSVPWAGAGCGTDHGHRGSLVCCIDTRGFMDLPWGRCVVRGSPPPPARAATAPWEPFPWDPALPACSPLAGNEF